MTGRRGGIDVRVIGVRASSTISQFLGVGVDARARGVRARSTISRFHAANIDFRAKGLRAASTKLQFRATELDLRAKGLRAASTKLQFRGTELGLRAKGQRAASTKLQFRATNLDLRAESPRAASEMSTLADQAMGSHFAVAPGNANTITGPSETFTYGLYWPEDAAWSGSAVFRLLSDDGIEKYDFTKGDGVASGNIVAFAFEKALPSVQYRGLLVDGDITLSLFGRADLCALQHPGDPCSHLPFPNPDDQVTSAPPNDADQPGADWPEPASTDDAIADDDVVDDYPVDPEAVANAASSPPPHPTDTHLREGASPRSCANVCPMPGPSHHAAAWQSFLALPRLAGTPNRPHTATPLRSLPWPRARSSQTPRTHQARFLRFRSQSRSTQPPRPQRSWLRWTRARSTARKSRPRCTA